MIVLGFVALSVELLILEAADRGHAALVVALPRCLLRLGQPARHLGHRHGAACPLLAADSSAPHGRTGAGAVPAPDRKRLLAVLAASLAALFINPYGWRLVWNPST